MQNLRPLLAVLAVPALYIAVAGTAESAAPLPNFDLELPFSFAAGQPARASEVNANFGAIEGAVEARATEVDDQLALVDMDINSLLSRTDAIEQDLAGLVPPSNLIRVAQSGAPFASVAEALASITDASAENRYLVRVAPGVYDETTTAIVPAFVTLQGAGPLATIIRSSASAASASSVEAKTVSLESGACVLDLAIENVGNNASSVALGGNALDEDTLLRHVVARAIGTGGIGHFGVHVTDSNLRIEDCHLLASGASTVNTGFGCADSGGPFAQPILEDCELEGLGSNSGFGAQITSTAMQLDGCRVLGGHRGIFSGINGISTIRNSRVEAQGLQPVYEQTGSSTILSGNVFLLGGNPIGLSSQFKYTWCIKANFDPIVNGTGSTVQP